MTATAPDDAPRGRPCDPGPVGTNLQEDERRIDVVTAQARRADSQRPGPRRPEGAPAGPDAVRRAVLDAAGDLFARRGVENVSLRDVARAADVQLGLIARYIGSREQLLIAVFADLSEALAAEVLARPLEQISFEWDSTMGRWTILLNHLVLRPEGPPITSTFNPVLGLATVIQRAYGLDDEGARLRGAQIVASALGWRIFEDYLITAGALDALPPVVLRDELTALHRRIGATPWPSPPDPQSTG